MENMLRKIRKEQNLTQMALARRIGSTPSWLTYIERYDYLPGPDLRERIAAALGVEVVELWPDLGNSDASEESE